MSINLKLRLGRPEAAESCGRICFEVFKAVADQHNFPPDVPSPSTATELPSSLLSGQDIYSVVAEIDRQVVGSNILRESASIAGVGPITIDPAVQKSNVGRALMENVLERARKQRFVGIRLVQVAYHNRSLALYTKLGVDAREPLSTLARLFGWKSRGTLSV